MLNESDLVPYSCSELPTGPFLVFAPHPDDETFGMGGTIAAATDAGIEVNVAFVTDGSCCGDPAIRRKEAEAACNLLGVKEVYFFPIKDRKVLEERECLEEKLKEIFSKTLVRTIFLPSIFEFHPDHRSTALIVWEYLKRSNWKGDVWFYEISRHGEVNKLICIDGYIDRKISAIRLYKSQLSERNYEDIILALNKSRTFTLEGVNYVEGFFRLSLSDSLSKYIGTQSLYLAGVREMGLDEVFEKPLVSVIVRTKDRPKLLKRTLKSIANQTYRHLEVVVVNDGGVELSVDELQSILGSIELKYIFLKNGAGRAGSANEGIRAATGKYVAFLDDDDEYYPEHIDVLVHCLEGLDFKGAYTNCRMVRKEFDPKIKSWSDDKELLVFGQPFSYEFLLFENYIPLISIMFERTALLETGGFDENLEKFEDWDLLIRFCSKYPLYHINTITCKYNSWSESMQILGGPDRKSEDAYLRVLSKHFFRLNPQIVAKWQFETRYLMEGRYKNIFEPAAKRLLEVEKKRVMLEKKVSEYEFQIEDLKRKLGSYKNKNEQQAAIIKTLQQQISIFEREVQNLSLELGAIYNSVSWKLINKLRKFALWLIPPDTRRRRLFEFLVKKPESATAPNVTSTSSIRNSIQVNATKPKSFDPDNFSVCFVVNHLDAGQRYRGYNMSEYLKYGGVESQVIQDTEVADSLTKIFDYDVIVLYRLFYSDYLAELVKELKRHGKVVVYDIDDYIFDDSALPYLNVRGVSKDELRRVINNHRRAMDLCDYCIVSTDALSRILSGINKKAFVLRNGLSDELIKISKDALKNKLPDTDIIKIGYFSGTATHDRDFLEASDALIYVLENCRNVKLIVGGHLKLDKRFDVFIDNGKVEFLPYVHWRYLPYNLVKAHINLVPLEQNIFNDAKSELKYFESAILQIPTIATPVESYKYAIRHGINGFLASSTEEWIECLEKLIKDRTLLKEMGANCYDHAISNYSPRAMSKKTVSVYKEIIELHLSSLDSTNLKIA